MLAIRDGELDAFKRLYLDAANQADEMLQEAAGRPGNVGRKMTALLLASIDRYDGECYLAASKRAVNTGDGERVKLLMEQAESHVSGLDPEYYGKVIDGLQPVCFYRTYAGFRLLHKYDFDTKDARKRTSTLRKEKENDGIDRAEDPVS